MKTCKDLKVILSKDRVDLKKNISPDSMSKGQLCSLCMFTKSGSAVED